MFNLFRRSAAQATADAIALGKIIAQRESGKLSDKEAIAVRGALEKYAKDMKYTEGQKIEHEGNVYEVLQTVEKSAGTPDTNPELYRKIVVEHTGAIDDPIPFEYGMDVRSGLYYSYQKKLWLCEVDMLPCTILPPDAKWEWTEVVPKNESGE